MKINLILTILVSFINMMFFSVPLNNSSQFEQLQFLGQSKLNDLIENNYWSHTNRDTCDFNCRTKDISFWIGENLYKGPCDINDAYLAWNHSPSHKKILDHLYNVYVLYMKSDKTNQFCYVVLDKALITLL